MVGLVGVTALALPLIVTATASADYAPQPGDVVGIGGDTPQYVLSFGADGDYLGDAGYNSAGAYNRLVTFNATADANGRASYAQGSTEATPLPLNPTVALRAGTSPVERNTSSSSGIVALLNDTASPENINFVFSASLPSTTQESTAASSTGLNWGGLHVVELGTDDIYMAADTTTNAVPLTISELYGIYVSGTISNWNQVGGTNAPIVPLVPPTGSSITNTFIKALNATVGSTATTITWDSAVQTVEQNDPTAITANASPTDAIAPFSQGRLNLWNAGYFFNPAAPYGSSNTATGNNGHGSPLPLSLASTPLSPGISLLSGSLPNGITGTTYKSAVTDYVIFRQDDATSTTPFQPGGTENWVQTLFSATPSSTVPTPPPPYFDTAAGRALIAAAGVTPSYDDLGLAA